MSADGLAITNYHVVSRFALDPRTYRLEYLAPDGAKGPLKLLAIDVAHDLAVVRIDRARPAVLQLRPARARRRSCPRASASTPWATRSTWASPSSRARYNGLVDKSYDERIHFSGAINPGMSGGPVTAADGRIVGVNVAKRLDGEQVGFLVPARYAAQLLERARKGPPLAVDKAREEVGRQLDAWQARFYEALKAGGFRSATIGPYRGLESAAPWVTCWAVDQRRPGAARARDRDQHARAAPARPASSSPTASSPGASTSATRTTRRSTSTRSSSPRSCRSARADPGSTARAGKRLTGQECRDDFVATGADKPPLRATWCMRAYREFEGLYNVTLLALTQDRDREALLATLSMQGVSHANAVALGRRFLEAIEWQR